MKLEFTKILKNRWLLCLFLAALLVNGLLFCEDCKESNGLYSWAQMRAAYADSGTLSDKAAKLAAYLDGTTDAAPEGLVTDDPYTEYALVQALLERAAQCTGYADFLQSVQADNAIRMHLGFLRWAPSPTGALKKARRCMPAFGMYPPYPAFPAVSRRRWTTPRRMCFCCCWAALPCFFSWLPRSIPGSSCCCAPPETDGCGCSSGSIWRCSSGCCWARRCCMAASCCCQSAVWALWGCNGRCSPCSGCRRVPDT